MTRTPTILRVDSKALLELLSDLRRTAANDRTLPAIDGVMLHVAKHEGRVILVGTSTDRYIMAQAHVEAEGKMPQTFLRSEVVDDLLSVLRPFARRSGATWEIESDGEKVRFTQTQLSGLPVVSVAVERHQEQDHKLVEMIDKLLNEKRDPSDELVTLDARFLALLSTVARGRHEAMRIQFNGSTKAALVQIGQRYKAIVMTMRMEGIADVPTFVPAVTAAAKGRAA